MGRMSLVTGGIRSGKSRFALELAFGASAPAGRYFIATAEALDSEMRRRIERHQGERGAGFETVEEPLFLGRAIAKLSSEETVILVDCLTLWVNNLLFRFGTQPEKVEAEMESLLESVSSNPARLIFVTNEVGLGIMADNPLAREFADRLGMINQKIAGQSGDVILMTAGIAQYLKREGVGCAGLAS